METGKWRNAEDEDNIMQTKDEAEEGNKDVAPHLPKLKTESWTEHAKKLHSFGPDKFRVKLSEWWILL